MKDNKLEVGDVVYDYCYGDRINKFVIDRTTKTMAFSGNTKFKINVYGNRVYYVGRGYDRAYINDKYIIEKFEIQRLISEIQSPNKLASISKEKLDQIYKILNNE